jgi:hypothetical protein
MRVRRSTRTLFLVPLLAPALALAAGVPAAAGAASARSAAAAKKADTSCGAQFRLDRWNFSPVPWVDNRWFPLRPGTRWILRGSVTGSSHRVETTVTDLTKVIDGVRAVVVLDEDFDGGTLQEAELAFFAQDDDGTVWALGEYPEEYDNGSLTGAPSTWIVRIQDATAGIAMRARPAVGTPAYRQGYAPAIGFDDCAVVVRNGARTCVSAGCYHNVLVTDEWAPNDPQGGHQRKFYAPGVGLVRVEPVGGDSPEILGLAGRSCLGPGALAQVRDRVLRMDRRGYTVSPDVYGRTAHADGPLVPGLGCVAAPWDVVHGTAAASAWRLTSG